jgi:hypothetical protein
MIRLTAKEIARASAGITIISRPAARGGYVVSAVRLDGSLFLWPGVGPVFAETKREIGRAAREVARWIDKMGYICPMADASRDRH